MISSLSMAFFILLFAFGQEFLGWTDPNGKVQLALFTCFVLGTACGYKTKG